MEKELNDNFLELSMSINQSSVKELLDVVDPPDQVKLKVLFNAVIKCTKDYNAEPSSARLKDWQKAEAALKEFSAQLREKYYPGEGALSNLQAVVNYLEKQGWKASKSTVYKHKKEGKIRPREDGMFLIKDAEKYAATFLKRPDGSTPTGDLEGIQREKLEAETKKAKAQAEHWDLKTRIATGEYVERAAFEHELAARAAVFRSDLENFIRSQAGGIINLVSGDTVKAPDLIEYMLEQMEIWLGRYAEEKAEFKTGEEIDATGA